MLLEMVENPLNIKPHIGGGLTISGHEGARKRAEEQVIKAANKAIQLANEMSAKQSAIDKKEIKQVGFVNTIWFLNSIIEQTDNSSPVHELARKMIVESVAPVLAAENRKIETDFLAIRQDIMENGF